MSSNDCCYLHSFWTRPFFRSKEARETDDLVLWDFEILTWLVSALEVRRHHPIRLITDSRGLRFVQRTGIAWVYDGGISTELEAIPEAIDPEIFWAAGKLFALREVKQSVVALDLDAILWQPLAPSAPAMALNIEDPRWPWYVSNRERYGGMGFDEAGWDWTLEPFTTAVVYCERPELLREYAQVSTEFMHRCSRRAAGQADRKGKFGDAMLFAEQRLLPMCLARRGVQLQPIAERLAEDTVLARNPICSHLWASKRSYKRCPEARVAYVKYLLDHLCQRHPEAEETVRRWHLDETSGPGPAGGLPGDERPVLDHKYGLITQVQGVVSILDSNVQARRSASVGSPVLPGEWVEAQPGATFELKWAEESIAVKASQI